MVAIQKEHSDGLTPGTLCWTRRPISRKNIDLSNRKSKSHNDNIMSETLWWPSLIYPKWSEAANHGGLMESTIISSSSSSSTKKRKSDKKEGVLIVGCRDKVSMLHLKKNMVPKKVALNHDENKLLKKPKVVAHYLGLQTNYVDQNELQRDRQVPSWTAVTEEEVIHYSKNVLTILIMYKDKIHRHDWQSLLNAMKEASIVTENPHLDPDNLVQILISEIRKKRRIHDDEDNEDQNNVNTTQTPEFFDDWKTLSRGSQSQSQSQSKLTQFSQVKSQSQHLLDGIQLDKKLVTPQQQEQPVVLSQENTNVRDIININNFISATKNDDDGAIFMKKEMNKSVQFADDQVSCSSSSNGSKSNDDSKSVETAVSEALVSDNVLLTQP